jgi:hypothetical protein
VISRMAGWWGHGSNVEFFSHKNIISCRSCQERTPLLPGGFTYDVANWAECCLYVTSTSFASLTVYVLLL